MNARFQFVWLRCLCTKNAHLSASLGALLSDLLKRALMIKGVKVQGSRYGRAGSDSSGQTAKDSPTALFVFLQLVLHLFLGKKKYFIQYLQIHTALKK